MEKMRSLKLSISLTIALSGTAVSIQAGYYQDTLFPIGLTGLNSTGPYPEDAVCPFGHEGWTWPDERNLINGLGINVIGCQDANPLYLVDINPGASHYTTNYLHQVCAPLTDGGHPVYLITANYWLHNASREIFEGTCSSSYIEISSGGRDEKPSSVFRAYFEEQGYWGAPKFAPSDEAFPACCGTETDNWATCDGNSCWQAIADTTVATFGLHFLNNPEHAQYIWGYNLLSENPAIYRKATKMNPWHGVWAAMDRVFTSHRYESSQFKSLTPPSDPELEGIRGAEDDVGMEHRMIVAKGATHPLDRGDYNIFQYLPDIDVFVCYFHEWCLASYNYGDQRLFNRLLYKPEEPGMQKGYHYTALYMKQYGDTYLLPEQERRWIPGLCLEWKIYKDRLDDAYCRRPCPPEIRCATYLCLSRGAKGILFHPWLLNYPDPIGTSLDPSGIQIPASGTYSGDGDNYWLGLRDQAGYPFGTASPRDYTHKLNNGVGSTHWHDHNSDYTYYYLANTLIPEIKRLAPWLVQMTWDTAFSRDCFLGIGLPFDPIRYIQGCRTKNILVGDYVDVGFFKDPAQVDYFMVVNRSRIAPYELVTVRIEIDKNKGQNGHLWITNLYDTTAYDLPHVNPKDPNSNYVISMDYPARAGKAFRPGVRRSPGSQAAQALGLLGSVRNKL